MPDPHSLEEPEPKSGCFIVLGCVVLLAFVSVALTLLVVWRSSLEVTSAAKATARIVAETFQKSLNFTPEVTVDSVVVIAANTPVLEIATAQRQALVRNTWSQTWLHSTKTMEIEAAFTARAGFDLTDTFRIEIDPRTGNLGATLPAPKILSVGMSDVRVLRDEDGLWNRLTPEDRQKAFAALEKKAREQFEQSDLVHAALDAGERRVRELMDQAGERIRLENPPPQP